MTAKPLGDDTVFAKNTVTAVVITETHVKQGLWVQAYRAELAPAVVSMLDEANQSCPPGAASRLATQNGAGPVAASTPAAVLHKDAIYAAAGTGAYELHDYIDFQPWLRHTLVQVGCTAPCKQPAAVLLQTQAPSSAQTRLTCCKVLWWWEPQQDVVTASGLLSHTHTEHDSSMHGKSKGTEHQLTCC